MDHIDPVSRPQTARRMLPARDEFAVDGDRKRRARAEGRERVGERGVLGQRKRLLVDLDFDIHDRGTFRVSRFDYDSEAPAVASSCALGR